MIWKIAVKKQKEVQIKIISAMKNADKECALISYIRLNKNFETSVKIMGSY